MSDEGELLRAIVAGFEYVSGYRQESDGRWSIAIEGEPWLTDEQRELLDSICDEVAP